MTSAAPTLALSQGLRIILIQYTPSVDADVVVVGAGPAGLAAALVLGRARRRVVLVDSGTYRNATVDAFHGFPGRDGASPGSFRANAVADLSHYDVEVTSGSVDGVVQDGSELQVALAGRSMTARRLVLATGVADDVPPVPGLAERWGKSAFTCPFCDGWEHRDRPVAVLAAADGADHLATMVRSWTPDVTVVDVDDVRRLAGEGTRLAAVEMVDGSVVPADAVFVRAPIRPRTALAAQLGCELDGQGFMVTSATGATSNPLVWAAGDFRRPPPMPHQVLFAAADGASAAFEVHKSLMAGSS